MNTLSVHNKHFLGFSGTDFLYVDVLKEENIDCETNSVQCFRGKMTETTF